MMAMLMAKAKAGNAEAIPDVNFLRSIGFIEDESKVEKEPTLSEIFDMCVAGSRQRKRDYWKQRNQ